MHKKVRGATRMADIWDLEEGSQVVIKVNAHKIPIDKESCTLTRFIGTLVRMPSFAPISYTSWHDMSDSKKEKMWETIKSKFEFQKYVSDELINEETIQEIKTWAIKNLATKWRQWKNDVKSKFYDEHSTPEEMAAKIDDPRVNKEQFMLIATHWLTGKAKEQSEQNRTNRSKLDEPHCTGTKSFSRIIQTMIEKANGVQPSRAEVYIHTRTRKDGSVVNEKAAQVMEIMRQALIENSYENCQQQSWKDDVYSKVKGPEKKGRVCCMGTMSTSSLKSVPSCSQLSQQNEKVERLETELKEVKDVLSNVLSLLHKQFPNENVNVLSMATRMINGEAPDAASGPNLSPAERFHSSNCSHQLNQNEDDATP